MKKIFYLSYYNSLKNNQMRSVALASKNKMDFIIKCLEKNNCSVTVISTSGSANHKGYKGIEEDIFNFSKLILFPCIGNFCIVSRILERLLIRISLIKFFLTNINKNSDVIVYHSLGYLKTIALLKKILKFRLIFEVEEIYGDVKQNKSITKSELKIFKMADAYIFPTELLNKKINVENKPYAIIHGTYNVESKMDRIFTDNKVHVVYAGTLDPRKGGGIAAVAAAQYLPNNYHLHILGFGNKKEITNIKKAIDSISEQSMAKVTYDGVLSGNEYIQFIQSCDIGLSTQNPNEKFNSTSFPSKVLSYLANGLRVVSVKIPAVEESKIGDLLYYYEEQKPREIAKTIRNIDVNEFYDSRKRIEHLSNQFEIDLWNMLESLESNERNEG